MKSTNMLCLCLFILSTVVVFGAEPEQAPNEWSWGNRLDVISYQGWPILQRFSRELTDRAALVSVGYQDIVSHGNNPRWQSKAVLHDWRRETYLHEVYPYYNVPNGRSNTRRLAELSGLSVKDIRFGRRFIAILTHDGYVWTAGLNTYGQLSGGTSRRPTFAKVQGVRSAKEIAVGAYHCVVLTWDNKLFSWGHSSNGALGYSPVRNRSRPKQFGLGRGASFTRSICCTWGACMALTVTGQVFTWGHSQQIGRSGGTRVPGLVQGIPSGEIIIKAECAVAHMVALTSSGRLYGWGHNSGCLLQATSWRRSATQLDLGGKVVRDVVAGNYLTIARTDANEVYYFGKYNGRAYTRATRLLYPRGRLIYPRDLMAKGHDGQDSIGAVRMRRV